jgi:hypothetical protein
MVSFLSLYFVCFLSPFVLFIILISFDFFPFLFSTFPHLSLFLSLYFSFWFIPSIYSLHPHLHFKAKTLLMEV